MRKAALTFPFALVDEGEEQLHLYHTSCRHQLYIILWSFCAGRLGNLGKFLKLFWHQQIMVSVHLWIYLSVLDEKIKVPHNMEFTTIAWWWTFSFLTLEGFLLLCSGGQTDLTGNRKGFSFLVYFFFWISKYNWQHVYVRIFISRKLHVWADQSCS